MENEQVATDDAIESRAGVLQEGAVETGSGDDQHQHEDEHEHEHEHEHEPGMGMMQAQSAICAHLRPCCTTTGARWCLDEEWGCDGPGRSWTVLDGPGTGAPASCDAAHSHRCTLAPLALKRRAARLKCTWTRPKTEAANCDPAQRPASRRWFLASMGAVAAARTAVLPAVPARSLAGALKNILRRPSLLAPTAIGCQGPPSRAHRGPLVPQQPPALAR